MRNKVSEKDIQIGVVAHFLELEAKHQELKIVHVPNEGRRSRREGNSLKKQGLRPGAPDLIFFLKGGGTLNVELKKSTGGVISEAQRAFGKSIEKLGGHFYRSVFADTPEDAVVIIEDLILEADAMLDLVIADREDVCAA